MDRARREAVGLQKEKEMEMGASRNKKIPHVFRLLWKLTVSALSEVAAIVIEEVTHTAGSETEVN